MRIEIEVPGDAEILLVDDDEQFHTLFKFIYKRSGLDNPLTSVFSGEASLAHLEAIDQQFGTQPALILMDINMPGMNGIETVQKIRQSGRFKTTPIIAMLTSSDYQPDIDRAFDAGANSYFTKPFDLSDFRFTRAPG